MKPFLKWAGSKTQIIEQVREALPTGKRLIEPFLGSGAVFLNAPYDRYLLADVNPDIIALYELVKNDPAHLLAELEPLFRAEMNDEEEFYRLRTEFNAGEGPRRPALFVYLNRHAFNGLCRYNASGAFNVPFGRYVRPYFPRAEILAFSKAAQAADFRCQPFEDTMAMAEPGDVVYCDPPYVPLSATSSFTSYAKDGFPLEAQRVLAKHAKELSERGIAVVISNHDTPLTRELYTGAEIVSFDVRRSIGGRKSARASAPELIAIFPARAKNSTVRVA